MKILLFLIALICLSSCQPANPQPAVVELEKPVIVEVEVPKYTEIVVTATPEPDSHFILDCVYIGKAVTRCIDRQASVVLYRDGSGLAAIPLGETSLGE